MARSPHAGLVARRLKAELLDDLHLDYETLAGVLDETLGADQLAYAVKHLKACRRCKDDLEGIRQVSLPVAGARRPMETETARASPQRGRGWRWVLVPAMAAAVAGAFWLGRATQPNQSSAPPPAVAVTPFRGLDVVLEKVDQLQREVARLAAAAQQRPTGLATPTPPRAGGSLPEMALDGDLPVSVRKVLLSGVLSLPRTVTSLFPGEEVLRGPRSENHPITGQFPTQTVVDDPQPEFSWNEGGDGWTFIVTLAPADGLGEVIQSGPLRAAPWRPLAPLPRGKVYTWQVSGSSPEGNQFVTPTPKPRFRVLDAVGHRALVAARRRYRTEPLVLGVLLAEHGVLHEAREQFLLVPQGDRGSAQARRFVAQIPGELLAPRPPARGLPQPPGYLALPAAGLDESGRRYPLLADAYLRLRDPLQLAMPDDWVRPYGPGEEGRTQLFKRGEARLVTRSGPGGAPAFGLAGEILKKYEQVAREGGRGGAFGPLGWATSDEEAAPPSRNGHAARRQHFEHGAIYHILGGPQKGHTFEVHDEPEANLFIYRRYVELGGCEGNQQRDPDLRYHPGLPDDNIALAAANPKTGQTGIIGRFEGCQIYGVRGRGTFVVAGKISDKFEVLGGTDDPAGFPVSDRVKTGPSGVTLGVEGVAQEFEGGTFYWRRFGSDWDGEAYLVAGEMLKFYLGLGGVKGIAGFPTSDAADHISPTGTRGRRQTFEGGSLYSSPLGTFWVPAATALRYEAKFGFPLEAPQPGGRQRFEGGTLAPVAP